MSRFAPYRLGFASRYPLSARLRLAEPRMGTDRGTGYGVRGTPGGAK
jgi:hypothetical protein